MTYLDAAYEILKQAGRPLHYRTITERALEQGLIEPRGMTPDATMGSRLYTDTQHEESLFVRAGRGMFGLVEWQPTGIEAHVEQARRRTRERLRELLHAMPPDRFEALIGELLIRLGFDENTVTVTQRSNDGGIDVMGVFRAAGITHLNAAVQVKRWRKTVGARIVRELRGSLEVHQQGIIITTASFTKSARAEAVAAGKTPIALIDGGQLLDLLIDHRVGVIMRTFSAPKLDDEWWGELLVRDESAGQKTSLASAEAPQARERSQREGNPTGKKPTQLILFGESHPVRTWKEVLVTTCEVLAGRHGDEFAAKAPLLKGRKRPYVSSSPELMRQPEPIPGTDFWVETHWSARNALRTIGKILRTFAHDPSNVEVFDIRMT